MAPGARICTYLRAWRRQVVLLFQLLTSAVAVAILSRIGAVQADPLVWEKIKPFGLVVVAFLGALFTNVKTLQYANLETFIVFRSSTPLLIAILDYFFLGRELPNRRSWLSLLCIVAGAILYVRTDAGFEMRAYTWVCAWVVVFAFDQTYIKVVKPAAPFKVLHRLPVIGLCALCVDLSLRGIVQRLQLAAERFVRAVWCVAAVRGMICKLDVVQSCTGGAQLRVPRMPRLSRNYFALMQLRIPSGARSVRRAPNSTTPPAFAVRL